MNSKYLVLLVMLVFVGTGLPAQQAAGSDKLTTHEEYAKRVINFRAAQSPITPEDKEWLKQFIDGGCQCMAFEEVEEIRNCTGKLLESLGLPGPEGDLDNMSPEQQQKFMLISPILATISKCPEH